MISNTCKIKNKMPKILTASEDLNESFYTPTRNPQKIKMGTKTKPPIPLYKCPDMTKFTFKSSSREEKMEKMRRLKAKILLMEENENMYKWLRKFYSKANSFSSKSLPSDFLRRRILLKNSADKINKEIKKNMKKSQEERKR